MNKNIVTVKIIFNFKILGENLMDISTLTKRYEYNHDTNINNQNYGYHKSTHDYQLQNTMTEIEKQQVCNCFAISVLSLSIIIDV